MKFWLFLTKNIYNRAAIITYIFVFCVIVISVDMPNCAHIVQIKTLIKNSFFILILKKTTN